MLPAAEPARKQFDLPADTAEKSLKRLAEQSGREVLFPADAVEGVQTKTVVGRMTPQEALDAMLAGTPLVGVQDEKTGALTVRRNDNPAGASSKPTKADANDMRTPAPLLQADAAGLGTEEETVVLSPFVVEASADNDSYRANSTLAGTRVRTELSDIASSLSVVTARFLRDTGATNNQSLLVYTTNTEVGGVYGNYGGIGNVFSNTASEPSALRASTNTRVRGLDSADNTRDYFATDIPWDSLNVDRVDLQRGPNSILFGIGSPAGIINSSVNMASFKNSYKLENRYGSFGSNRNSIDLNYALLPQQLAIRVAALSDLTEYRQRPAYNRDRRIFGAVRFDPKLFNSGSAHTTIRANVEHGHVKANRPMVLPPLDQITPFFNGVINKTTLDPYYASISAIVPSGGSNFRPAINGESIDPWIPNSPGIWPNGARFYYNANSGAMLNAQSVIYPGGTGAGSYYGIDSTGARVGTIAGLANAGNIGIGGYGTWAYENAIVNPNDPTTRGAALGFYKDKTLNDPTIFDFYNNLLRGDLTRQWQNWDAFNVAFEQTFLNNRIGLQLVYDYQEYNDGDVGNLDSFITVDMMANSWAAAWPFGSAVTKYNGTGPQGTNPNAGRAYAGGSGYAYSGQSYRENVRATGTAELRATDLLSKSLLTDILGRHVFTGLYSKETLDRESRSWEPYALDASWPDAVGSGPLQGGGNALNLGTRKISLTAYLSEPLFGRSSASGLDLKPITSVSVPSGTANIAYFDSHWKASTNPADPTYVDPAAPWTNPQFVPGQTGSPEMTQSANPANYVGWTNRTFNILNADEGDIKQLYTTGSKVRTITDSKAATWQGYLWEDTLVATVGWRRDVQKQRSNTAPVDAGTGVASMNYDLLPLDEIKGVSKGESKSWGLVLHEPKFLRDKLPWGTNISLLYSEGNNNRVQNRYSFDGNPLPNASGHTKDYGFVVSTLNDRLTFKVAWYKTLVKNANITSNPGAWIFNSNVNLWLLPEWALSHALINRAGFAGEFPGAEFVWDDAAAAGHVPWNVDNWKDPTWLADPATIKQKAATDSFLAQLPPQSWWDAYGLPVNVAEAKAGNWNTAIKGWKPDNYQWGVPTGTGGLVNGSVPTGTIDNQSKGVEMELTGQVTKNWSVSVNASKQRAEQISLGSDLTAFIEGQWKVYSSDAGNLRLWSASDQTIRQYYQQTIYSTYLFLKGSNGRMVSEMAPWRVNAVTNYSFDRGLVKGLNVGLGYRWQQGTILGYAPLADYSNLDVDKPYWGKSTDALDLWVGYDYKLTPKINWRVQLNVRNVGSKVHLQTVSVEPDGTPAMRRIVEGQTWFLTNTLSF